jgi:hypothetical protein
VTRTIAILGLVRDGDPDGPRLDREGRRALRRLRRDLGDLDEVCKCSCIRNAHRHWRAGSDCGRCGRAACRAFRPARRRFEIIPWRRS